MKNQGTLLFVGLLLSGSLLAACGLAATPNAGPSASSDVSLATTTPNPSDLNPSPPRSDACSLLTKDDVGRILGQAVEDATAKGLGGVCSYKTKSLSLDLTVFASGGTAYLQQTQAKIGDLALVVPGLGDEAFYNTNSFVNTLFVRKGDAAYLIDVINQPSSQELSPEDVRAKEKALAEQLLSNLP